MVKPAITNARDAERALAIGYALADRRPALIALLGLDRRLGELAVVGREPMLAQMRLAWWHDALNRLDGAPPPPEPLLTALAAEVLPRGVGGAGLAAMVDGWEVLLDLPPDDDAVATFATRRGSALFAIAAHVLGGTHPAITRAGEGWALADLSRRLAPDAAAARIAAMARKRLKGPTRQPWPRALRPLGALALLARADLHGIPPGAPRRVARLAWHRLTGR